jgi:hypothetical protein
MPRPGESISEAEAAYEREVRRDAQRIAIDHHFLPKTLLENSVEAFATWLVTYFPHRVPEVEDWQIEPLECLVHEPRALILVPAGTMKTTIGAELYRIWRLCQSRDYETRGFFKSDDEAKKPLGAVKKELRFNEKLIADYGAFYPGSQSGRRYKWNEHEIEVLGRTRISKEPSLAYYPYGGEGKALGGRFHQGFIDDIVTRELAHSPEQTNKSMEWLGTDFETGPYSPDSDVDWIDHDGNRLMEQITVFGTRMTPKDTFAKIEERNEKGDPDNPYFRPYKVVCIDIVKDWDAHETISKRWPWDKLMAKKAELQEPAFSMRMRNIALNVETMVFKEPWLIGGDLNGVTYPGCRDRKRSWLTVPAGAIGAIGYDPQSGSKTRYAKEAAIVGLTNVPTAKGAMHPHLFDWWSGQAPLYEKHNPNSQIHRVVAMAKAMNQAGIPWVTIRLEANNIQAGLEGPIRDLAQEEGVRLIIDTPNTGANKEDDETGIEACAPEFQNGWVSVPYMTPQDQEKAHGFEHQMIEYGTSKYYDVPMAYWMAHVYLYQQRFATNTRPVTLQRQLPHYMQRRGIIAPSSYRVVNAHMAPPKDEEARLE